MTSWVIVCNLNSYDVVGAFSMHNQLDWKQSTNVKKGDIVYIKELYKREIKLNKDEIKGLKKLRKSCKMVDKINHVGVYCGKTSGGKEIWCHCASSMHGVVVMKGYKKFKCFYRSL